MSEGPQRIHDLTLKEIELFLFAAKTRSFREVARQWGMQAGHLSKVMKKIEEKVGFRLFSRSIAGVTLTPEAHDLFKTAEKISELSHDLHERHRLRFPEQDPLWTSGSISFLATYLLAPTISRLRKRSKRRARFRLVEFTHNDLVAHGLRGAFELAIHIGRLEWTQAWQSVVVGKLAWRLYGCSQHPLPSVCKESDILKYPFIVPTDWSHGGYTAGNDHCPLSVRRREKGDEAATAETALELCRNSRQLTFVPEILARVWAQEKLVKEIHVQEWPRVEREIYLSVKADSVPHWLLTALEREIKSVLDDKII